MCLEYSSLHCIEKKCMQTNNYQNSKCDFALKCKEEVTYYRVYSMALMIVHVSSLIKL